MTKLSTGLRSKLRKTVRRRKTPPVYVAEPGADTLQELQPATNGSTSPGSYEALLANDKLYRLLADNVTDWVTRMNPQGEYLYASPSTRLVLGYEPEELLGKLGHQFIHPDDYAMVQDAYHQALAAGSAMPLLTYRRRHKAGHYVWLETKSSAVCSPETGKVLEFVMSARDITERKRAEEALQAKIAEERTLQQSLKTLHEITIELTTIDQLDDFYRRVIELGLERLGFERLGLLFYDAEQGLAVGTYGTNAQGHVIPEHHIQLDPSSLTNILQRALVSPERFAFDAKAALFDHGKCIGRGWNAAAVLWNGQQNLGWLAADNAVHQRPLSKPLLDILILYSSTIGTLLARKQVEVALRKSEEKFRLLVEAAPLAIIISDQTGQITLVNHCAEQLFGYLRADLLGQTIDLLVPIALRGQHAAKRATYVAAPRIRQMGMGQELYARRQDGHEFPVEIELSYVETPNGMMMMSFILDISERKQSAVALRTQRDFLQLIINSVPNLISVKDRAGHFRLVNEASAALFGITPPAMLGKTDADINPNPSEVAFFRQKDQEVLDSGQPVFIPEQTIMGRHYQTSKIPLKQTTGQADHLLIVSSDITARKQTEEALQQALAKEKELSELKSRFVSMASHEFRTPLASILAVTETLSAYRHKLDDEEVAERLSDIRAQVHHLKALMEDVLHLARIQASRVEFKPICLDLTALCHSVLNEFRGRPDVHHQLIFQPDTPVCEALLDKKLMRQILTNLVTNAIKYSPEDKAVVVHLQATGTTLILQVRDEGIGIPAADLKHLFQPFHRAANAGEIAGTGLGLTITKEAVELHGGTIAVDTQLGLGTTFTIDIPIRTCGGKEDGENLGD